MEIRRWMLVGLLFACLSMIGLPSLAQDNDPITMLIDAGFDSFYRPGYWLPIQIQMRNEGLGFSGRLTVRPESSGRAVNSGYSTPIDLPTGSDKTVFLYIQLQPGASNFTVELIDNEGVRAAEQAVGVTSILPSDSLHVVVSSTSANSIPMNSVAQAGFTSRQARWEVDNLPTDVAVLRAIDTILLYDVQSETFSAEQLEALEAWVAMGGHLIVVGGPAWAQTIATLPESLLPFIATGSQNIDDISTMAQYISADSDLATRTFITTGDVSDIARVLIETDEGLALYVRRELGLGIVDFMTVDPTLEPLRSWTSLSDFWFTVLSDMPPEPGWRRGLVELQEAARAIAILPNINLLPAPTSMIIFITAYILLIGPVNYFVLSRLQRRAWAWLTIPLLILAFTLIAWNAGFNLRGNEVTVSRLYVIHSFSDTNIAYQEQLVGVLSPRREIYTVNAPANTVMGILPGVEANSVFSANVSRTTAEISQGQNFTVEDIAIDGGIFANFGLSSVVSAPEISGNINFAYLPQEPVVGEGEEEETVNFNDATPQSIRGVLRNDSDITLEDVVIVTRNRFYRLENELEPGDIIDFATSDFHYINSSFHFLIPIASPFQSRASYHITEEYSNRRSDNETLMTARLLLNLDWTNTAAPRDLASGFDFNDEEMIRRRAFLQAFLRDQYAAGGFGNQAYVFGWTNEQHPDDVTISDVGYRSIDTTLHIIELETAVELPPSSETITLYGDQFTWVGTDISVGQASGGANELTIINPGWAEFLITPLEGAVLSDVTDMLVEVDRGTSMGRQIELSLWNWNTAEWDTLESTRVENYEVENPAPYLGRNNAVKLRLSIDTDINTVNPNGRVSQIRVIQRGNF